LRHLIEWRNGIFLLRRLLRQVDGAAVAAVGVGLSSSAKSCCPIWSFPFGSGSYEPDPKGVGSLLISQEVSFSASNEGVPVLEVRELVKTYGGIPVVDKVSFAVKRGEILVVVGPNGSGKTTAIECIVQLRVPDSGTIQFGGSGVRDHWEQRRYFGVQLQESAMPPNIRVKEAIDAVAVTRGAKADVDSVLTSLQIGDLHSVQFEKLSGGQKRRVRIAAAIVGTPPLIILDEPTSGIDPEGRGHIWRLFRSIARSGRGFLVATHDLSEAEDYADQIVALDSGRVVLYGSVDDVIREVGAWRIRVLNPSQQVKGLLDTYDCTVAPLGPGLVALGERATVEKAGLQIRESNPGCDVLVGPVRLEDLYAIVTHKKSTRQSV